MATYTLGQNATPVNVANNGSLGTGFGNGAYRGIGGDWFNAENIAREDWQRGEQSADLALQRSMYQQEAANQFNATEAQKQRDFEERMAKNSYTYAVEDMKRAGLNPILAYSQGGASVPNGAAASSSTTSQTPGNTGAGVRANTGSLISLIASIAGGMLNAKNALKVAGMYNDTSLKIARLNSRATTTTYYNGRGQKVRSITTN